MVRYGVATFTAYINFINVKNIRYISEAGQSIVSEQQTPLGRLYRMGRGGVMVISDDAFIAFMPDNSTMLQAM